MKKKSEIKKIFYCLIIFSAFAFVGVLLILGRFHKNLSVKSENIIFELKKSSERKNLKLTGIFINSDNDIIAFHEDVQILFSTEKDVEKQTQALQKILKGTKINKTIRAVDFRFNKIVVR